MDLMQPFTHSAAVSRYAEDTPKKVPGLADLHRMACLLLQERAPAEANILVLGAGGGLELKAFAEARPRWRFVGIDPSSEMLDLANQILGPLAAQVQLLQGRIEDAPTGPFDGATCLLTLHFLERSERFEVLRGLQERLRPGAPLVLAHHCIPEGGTLQQWLTRSAAFAQGPEPDFTQASASAATMAGALPLLTVREEEALLSEAGFSDIALFYAGFSFRGWVAIA